jgi:hypothetical protein
MANGLAEILPNRPFCVRVVKSSEKDRKLPKGMVLGQALPQPTGIVTLTELDPKPLAKPSPTGLQIALSPEEYAISLDPPALLDRPDVGYALEIGLGPRPPRPPRTRKSVGLAHKTLQYMGREVGTGPLHTAPHPADPRSEARLFAALPCRREGEGSGFHGNPKDVKG